MTGLPARDLGLVQLLQEALPGVALAGFALITWLGSVPVAIGILALAYWFGPRERGAVGLAAGLAAVGLTLGLKAVFALPRPPVTLRLVEARGFGFPSGHAIVATVLWGHLALATTRWPRRHRLLAAGALVGLVGLSRVALGVHHAVDVVAGFAAGAALLLAVRWLDDADRGFGLAVLVAGFATLVTGGGGDAVLLLGGTVAGVLLLRSRLSVPATQWRWAEAVPAALGGATAGSLLLAGYRLTLPRPVEFAVGAAAVAGVLGLPAAVERLRRDGT